MRSVLVIAQFSVSSILIVATIVFNLQLRYMKRKPLGFDKEQMLIVDFQRLNYNYDPLPVKEEFLKHPSVTGASFSSSVPGRWLYPWEIWPAGQRESNTRSVQAMGVDKDFFRLYKIDLIAGEKFEEHHRPHSWILNEQAVRAFGWDSPAEALNKTILDDWNVIGVMKDFHFTGLQEAIGPAGFFLTSKGIYLTLKIDTENIKEVLSFVKKTYHNLFPGKYIEFFFLDDDFNRHYRKEEQVSSLFNVFTFLGIFIACLGLFGLSAFMVQRRSKEIGVRKVLGATSVSITAMLASEFVKWVAISNFIACPIAYIIVKKILQNFAYRIDLGIEPFLITILITTFIALLAVSFQSIKAALANPIESLRYE